MGRRGRSTALAALMTAEFDRTLTHGPLHAAVWRIAWPTMLLNLAGGLQGIVDHVTVGRFVGFHANAAIGVGWQIFAVFIVFVTALYGGVGVLVARLAGAGEAEKVHRVFSQALAATLVLAVGVFAPVGWMLAPRLLELVHAAPEVRAEALPYLRTLYVYNAGLTLFLLLASALRAAGDARTPMRLSLLMTAINVTLTVVLVRGWGPIPAFGARGAALSTVAAGAIVAALAFHLLFARRLVVRFAGVSALVPDAKVLRQIFRFGLPMGLQSIALHVAGVVLVGFVGSLDASAEAQAAYSVAYSQIFLLLNLVSVSLLSAVATVAGQSLGAGRAERAADTPWAALAVGLALNLPLAFAFLVFPRAFLGLFGLEDPQVLLLGSELLRILSVASGFSTAAYVYIGALQGTGDTRGALGITLVSQLAVPIGLCALLGETSGLTARGIWLAIALGHLARCALSIRRFRRGRWREIRVDVGQDPGSRSPDSSPLGKPSGNVL